MEKPVFIINGFLDSGKTTFIKETLSDPQFLSGGKLLIIQCEEGEEELDEVALSKLGVSIISVEEQSQLTGEFLNGLELYYNPNMILIEMNGMWNMDEMMELDYPEDWVPSQIISLVDGSTIQGYLTNMKKMILDLIRYSDIIIVNRCDDNTDKTFIRRSIKPVNRKAQIIYERADGTASATFFSDCGNRRIVSSVTDSDTQVASSDIKIAAATDPMPLMHSKRSALRGAGWFDEAMLSWKDIAGNPRVAQKDGVNVVDIGAYQYHVIPGLTVFVH